MHVPRICRRLALVSLLGVFGAALIEPSPSSADTFTWTFSRKHPRKVQFQVYAKDPKQVWPREGRVWSLNDFVPHIVRVDCVKGQKICYGAWDPKNEKIFWGKGHGGKKGCTDCCFLCTEGKGTTVLPELVLHDDN